MKVLKYTGFLLAAIVLAETVSKFSFFLADKTIGSDVYLPYITVHHLFQMALAWLLIFLVCRFKKVEPGVFGLQKFRGFQPVKEILIFSGIWAVIQFGVGYWLLSAKILPVSGTIQTPAHLFAEIAFQLGLSGTSEELLYRGLIIGMFGLLFSDIGSEKFKGAMIYGVSLVPFLVGHIPYSLSPFNIGALNVLQLLTVLIFGAFYTYLLRKHRSVYPAMLAHGLLNTVIVLSGYGLARIFS